MNVLRINKKIIIKIVPQNFKNNTLIEQKQMRKSQEHQDYQETNNSIELIEKNRQAKVFKDALEKIQRHPYSILP
jgi:hypothetical protein